MTLTLPVATSDTVELVRYAWAGRQNRWQPGQRCTNAGAVRDGLGATGHNQLGLFEAASVSGKHTLPWPNRRFGQGKMRHA